ncbi:MAG: hydroxymethylglutaryl-CoA lyase [Bacteroidales bacterium]
MTSVVIHEVGLRDGLQVEKSTVPTAQKIAWVERLLDSKVDIIQLGSFVHREKVPQMADTDELFRAAQATIAARRAEAAPAGEGDAKRGEGGEHGSGPQFSGLVLNEKGLERGLACGVRFFCMGVSASDTHSRKNTGMSTAEATERILGTAKAARDAGAFVQVSVQSAFGCGFEGVVPEDRVVGIARRFVEAGFTTISLADTAGHGVPHQVERLFAAVRAIDPAVQCACHLHDTYGFGLANAYAALRAGVTYFEAAFAGIGGCPFTAVTGGNVCTEDLVHMFHRMGLATHVTLEPILDVAKSAAEVLGRELPGRTMKTGVIPRPCETA